MKRTVFAAFVAFWSSLATLVAVDLLSPEAIAATTTEPPPAAISVDAVAAHASGDDCWVIIEGKVYDITAYIPQHPTPAAVLLPWCGRDATEGMRTKGYGRDHSPAAWGMLEHYLKGPLATAP
jgi:cytochrome b involved in lipid metabolism